MVKKTKKLMMEHRIGNENGRMEPNETEIGVFVETETTDE